YPSPSHAGKTADLGPESDAERKIAMPNYKPLKSLYLRFTSIFKLELRIFGYNEQYSSSENMFGPLWSIIVYETLQWRHAACSVQILYLKTDKIHDFIPTTTTGCMLLLEEQESQSDQAHTSSFPRQSQIASSEICMPSLSPTMSEGTIVKWYKKEDVMKLCETKPENTTDIKVGTLIAIMVEEGDDWQNVEVPAETEAAPSSPAPPTQDKPTPDTPIQPLAGATKIGHEELHGAGIGPSRQAPPSGDASQSPPPSGAPAQPTMADTSAAGGYVPTLVPEFVDFYEGTASITTIPHSYATMDCNVGPVTSLRKQLIKDSIKVSVNDFIIKSAALALQNDEPASMLNVDICVAVATDNGLITPIVQNTPQLAVDEISSTVKKCANLFAQKISNLGMFGIGEFSAVINPPQTAILAVGSSRLAIGQNGKPESRMAVTLSYDARVIDDSEASLFLEVFRDIIENPSLLVSGRPASKRQDIL
ncbi:ODPX-like protein, partial [Mya arenaria]